ncbi:ribonucleotide reductase N-terminal alpha domain-containing protein, partial [Prevotella jejuni]|uniref:ribonucleotide reductase N-terminal alpha domain-containing protein n=1 Tax=Prevotella jejuni TaxID=1177574 RepID=UPI003211AF4D
MDITKRNGEIEVYDNNKISIAIKKSFISTGKEVSNSEIAGMVSEVEQFITDNPELRTVEDIQNRVEKCLMAHGHYDEAKNYILFRYQRNEQRQAINYIAWAADDRKLADVLQSVAREYRERSYSMVTLQEKFSSFSKPGMSQKDAIDALIKAAVELTTPEAPSWEMISARILSYRSEKNISRLEEEMGLRTFYRKLKYMTEEGLYGDYILQNYSEEEINEAATFIDPERNKLLNYSGLDLLLKRYVIKNYSGKVIERVQEMFLGIALHLAMPEKEDRLMWVRRIYDLLSKLEVTMATPTLSNSRKPSHQ